MIETMISSCVFVGGLVCDGEIFFRGTGKALQSIITRHPDENSNCVQIALEALRRAAILGEPVRIHQRLVRYCNNHLVSKYMYFLKKRKYPPHHTNIFIANIISGSKTVLYVWIYGLSLAGDCWGQQIQNWHLLGAFCDW